MYIAIHLVVMLGIELSLYTCPLRLGQVDQATYAVLVMSLLDAD